MLNLLRKNTASVAEISRSATDADQYDDISAWELVNASLSDDDEDLFSFDDDVTGDDVTGDEPVAVAEEEEAPRVVVLLDDVMSIQSLSVSPPMTFPVEVVTRHRVYHEEEEEKEDEEDDVYGDDVDDELVPWKLKGKFGKQRITKMGKRGSGGPSFNKSKRLPYYDNRPGFLCRGSDIAIFV